MQISKLLLVGALSASSLFAHSMWLNSFESFSKRGGHAIVSLGWGHSGLVEDSLRATPTYESYNFFTPSGKKITLEGPLKKVKEIYSDDSYTITENNMAMQKIKFDKNSEAGTYTVGYSSTPTQVTRYINTKGKSKFTRKAPDKIRDLKEVISTSINSRNLKTYFVYKNWSEPQLIGHDLEIVPVEDFSKLYIGDKITVKVFYKGEPVKSGYVLAKSSSNKGDNSLYAGIRKGEAKFTLTNTGQWHFSSTYKEKIDGMEYTYKANSTINIK